MLCVDVEYGYAVGTEANINTFIDHYKVADTTAYTLQYKGENVNGKNTTAKGSGANTDYRYITNINCTKGTTNTNGKIKNDHQGKHLLRRLYVQLQSGKLHGAAQ